MFLKRKKIESNDINALRILNDSTPFAIREAFSSFCTNVLYLPIEDKCKKIVITSAVPGEGKTYIATNLAITLAKNLSNKKILLIDMDMRNPSVTNLYHIINGAPENKTGLSEYLAGLDETPSFVTADTPNLSIIFAGAATTNPAGLINSSRMSDLLRICEQNFDYVIIDTPPVTLVSDATLLVNRVNGYILATRSDYSNVKALSEAFNRLESVDAQIFGVVLSDLNLKKTKSGHGTYGKYDYNHNYS